MEENGDRGVVNTLAVVQSVLMREFDLVADECKPSASLVSLGLDSLEKIELVNELEEAFDIEIPNDDLAKIVTIQDIVNYAVTYADQRSPRV